MGLLFVLSDSSAYAHTYGSKQASKEMQRRRTTVKAVRSDTYARIHAAKVDAQGRGSSIHPGEYTGRFSFSGTGQRRAGSPPSQSSACAVGSSPNRGTLHPVSGWTTMTAYWPSGVGHATLGVAVRCDTGWGVAITSATMRIVVAHRAAIASR